MMNLSNCKIGTYVGVDGEITKGIIVGHAMIHGHDALTPLVCIRLDSGFYNEGKSTYVSIMLAHPDSLYKVGQKN